ncbi:MAG: hypothetical protein HFJ05_11195 [Eubacterium sp.]|nr:hypothetical protein [Eubacterium sp.]
MKHWIIVIVAITLMILHERLSAILERDYSHTHSDWNDIYFCKWQNPIYSKKSVSLCSSEYTVFLEIGEQAGINTRNYSKQK